MVSGQSQIFICAITMTAQGLPAKLSQTEIARQSAPRSGPEHKQKNIIAAVQIYCRGKVVVSNRPAYEHKSKLNMRKCHILQCYTSSNACPLPKNNHACKHQAKDRYTSSITR